MIAVLAICATPPPAKADIWLEITAPLSGGSTGWVDLTTAGALGSQQTVNSLTGYSITYTVTAPSGTPGAQALTLTSSASYTGSNTGTLNYFLDTTNGAVNPGVTPLTSQSSGALATSLVGTGQFNLLSSLTGSTPFASGNSVSMTSTYYAYSGSPTSSYQNSYSTGTATVTSSTGSDVTQTNFASTPGTFNIGQVSLDQTIATGTADTFTAVSQVSLPEPSGVAASLMGIPFMGAFVVFGFRRQRLATPSMASV